MLLYGVIEASTPAVGYGLEQQPLRTITHGGVRAVISDHEATPGAVESNMWAYEQVAERLMTSGPVLPARYGTVADNDAAIETMLTEREDEFTRGLERVRGAVEIAIRTEPPPPVPPGASGTEYMRARLGQEHQDKELIDKIEAAAGAYVRARTRRSPTALAYLVEQERVADFIHEAAQLGLTPTGPWPPYSFVNDPGDPDDQGEAAS